MRATSPVLLIELIGALLCGMIGAWSLFIGLSIWRKRNGGRFTIWIVLILFTIGVNETVGAFCMAYFWAVGIEPLLVSRLMFWPGRIMQVIVMLMFVFWVLPRMGKS